MPRGAAKHLLGHVGRDELETRLREQRSGVSTLVDQAKRAVVEAQAAKDATCAALHQLKLDVIDLDSIRARRTATVEAAANERIAQLEQLIESRTLRGRWRQFVAWLRRE